MNNREAIKDHVFEAISFQRRVVVVTIASLILLVLLLGRLYYLQAISYAHYTTLSTNNRVRLMAVPPTRGLIFDRNGVVLAQNLPTYRLEVTPEEVNDLDATLSALPDYVEFDQEDVERFKKLLKRKRPFEGIPLRFNMSDAEVARFSVRRHQFPGVHIAARLSRVYPLGEKAVHTIGYVGRIDERELQTLDEANYRSTSHVGKVGVEKYYEDLLHGTVGYEQVEVNAEGRVLRVLDERPSVPGRSIYLTLDIGLQTVAENALGRYSGAIVAMDPKTGQVIALASRPTFDPNLFVKGIKVEVYEALRMAEDQPLFNRALAGRYPPGSTIKPFVALAALETGVQDAGKKLFCGGYFKLPNDSRRYRDWKKWGHGTVDLDAAITQSCDVYFYDLALRMGIDRIAPYLKGFGFGERTGIDTVGEAVGLLPSRAWKRATRGEFWYPGETIITGIGQGYLSSTPLQLASATATLAMAGKRLRPRLLLGVEDPQSGRAGLVPPDPGPPLEPVPINSPEHWRHILEAMLHVTATRRGTAYEANRDANYTVAGKTGTAQVFGIAQDAEYKQDEIAFKLHDHALFVAFAPAEDPQIAISVVVEHGGSGGSVAAPMARKVMDAFFEAG